MLGICIHLFLSKYLENIWKQFRKEFGTYLENIWKLFRKVFGKHLENNLENIWARPMGPMGPGPVPGPCRQFWARAHGPMGPMGPWAAPIYLNK